MRVNQDQVRAVQSFLSHAQTQDEALRLRSSGQERDPAQDRVLGRRTRRGRPSSVARAGVGGVGAEDQACHFRTSGTARPVKPRISPRRTSMRRRGTLVASR